MLVGVQSPYNLVFVKFLVNKKLVLDKTCICVSVSCIYVRRTPVERTVAMFEFFYSKTYLKVFSILSNVTVIKRLYFVELLSYC